MPIDWQRYYQPATVPPEIEATARTLIEQAVQRRRDLWLNVSQRKLEAIIFAVAVDLHTDDTARIWVAPSSDPDDRGQ